MKKVALTELDPRLQKQIAAAEQQLKTNPQYAVEVLTGILARNPGCIEVRRTLRKAQKAMLGTKKGLFDGLTGALTAGKVAKAVEADPVAAIAAAEEALAKKPTDANAKTNGARPRWPGSGAFGSLRAQACAVGMIT